MASTSVICRSFSSVLALLSVIERMFSGTMSALDDLLRTASDLLAELTDYTSLASAPPLAQGRRRTELEGKAWKLFDVLPCEPIRPAAGDQYAHVKISQQRRGVSLDENDLWIAVTALAIGAVLVSRDSDFQRIGGLTIQDWSV